MESIWKQTVHIPERQSLKGDRKTEVAVIGAGLAGLLTAYLLQRQGKEVMVLEANRIGSGQTGNTTAKITSQHGLFYDDMLKRQGKQWTGLYARAHQDAIKKLYKLVEAEGIDCHWDWADACLYTKDNPEKLEKEAKAAHMSGIPAFFKTQTNLPFPVAGAVCFREQAQFHPLKFIAGLAEKLTIYEKTIVYRVLGGYHKNSRIETNGGTVWAEQVVFATHYPFPKIPGFYFVREHQERSYVIALSGVPKWQGMYYGIDQDGLSFRWQEDILLVGGGGHRSGNGHRIDSSHEKNETNQIKKWQQEYGYTSLEQQIRMLFPEAKEVTRWSAQDCMPHRQYPLIGQFSIWKPNWYVITGFQKWGMTTSMVAAELVCDNIMGRQNLYEKLFSPWSFGKHLYQQGSWTARISNFGKRLGEDVGYSITGLVKGLWAEETLTPHEQKISLRCSHLGCKLHWNGEEKTWDCPCHGSCFDQEGRVLDGPAYKDLSRTR